MWILGMDQGRELNWCSGLHNSKEFLDQSIRLSYVAHRSVCLSYTTQAKHTLRTLAEPQEMDGNISHTHCLSVACTGNGHNQSAEEEDTSSTYRRSENLEKVSSILELRLMHICTETAKARQAFRLQHFVSSTEINICSSSRDPVFKNRAIKAVQCAKLRTVVPCTIISVSAECDNDHFSPR